MLGLCLLAAQLLLVLVQEERAVGGPGHQRLEDVRHGAEAVLRAGLWLLGQQPLLGADGTELEVLPVHGDVGGQGLQVQLTEVRLRTKQQRRTGETSASLRALVLPPAPISCATSSVPPVLQHLQLLPMYMSPRR